MLWFFLRLSKADGIYCFLFFERMKGLTKVLKLSLLSGKQIRYLD